MIDAGKVQEVKMDMDRLSVSSSVDGLHKRNMPREIPAGITITAYTASDRSYVCINTVCTGHPPFRPLESSCKYRVRRASQSVQYRQRRENNKQE